MGRRRGRWRRAGKGQEWEGKGEAGGWTRRSGVVRGRQDWDNGGGDWEGAMGRGRWRGGNLKGEMGGGQQEGGDGKGVTREGQKGGGEEGARGGGILQMDMI